MVFIESAKTGFRKIFTYPDVHKNLIIKHSRIGYYYVYFATLSLMFLGYKGIERLNYRTSPGANYLVLNRLKRFFMPYTFFTYKWKK